MLLHPWDFPGTSTGVGCHFLLQRIFPTQGSNQGGVICISEVFDIPPGNLDSSCESSSPAFHMMYSACELKKQGDNTQPGSTIFPILNQSVFLCRVLTSSWPAYRFLRRQVSWSWIIAAITSYSLCPTLPSGTPITYDYAVFKWFHSSLVLFQNFLSVLLYLWFLFRIVSIAMSSSTLIFPSAVSNHLLILSNVF